MAELFEEDELIDDENLSVMDNAIEIKGENQTIDARRRLENMLANKQLNKELDDLADYI